MEPNLFRYIWRHTRRDQIWVVCIVLVSMIPYYMSFDLPKQLVNGPITGVGFEAEGDTLPFLRFELDLPWMGHVVLFPGIDLERIPILVGLSFAFLALVVVNGLFKVYINTFKGRLGERLLRRIRFDLVDRILRFPPERFRRIKSGEISSMVKDEVEPLGGFTSDAFVQPVFLGGQALTALAFIFVQNLWLGLLAAVMASIQVAIIPRMRQRLIVLGRERQLTARQLAGRVSEIVDGINVIRASDATNFERADISERLGRIFKIRYDLYQWKFFVKFVNNFIAQLTPFMFYLIGGYLTIQGTLDVGQLVAVIAAYKELPGPMKELIDWDLARQDVQVKYEQVIEQFDSEVMIDPNLHKVDPSHFVPGGAPLNIRTLSLSDDSGNSLLSQTTLKIEKGETVAFVGNSGSGGEALAEVLARVMWPAHGHVQLGGDDLFQLPESVSGRRVTYASTDDYFTAGSLEDNLLFSLKNAPRAPACYEGEAASFRKWQVQEAGRSGNPVLDLNDDWIDVPTLLEHTGTDSQRAALGKVLEIVGLVQDVVEFGLRARLDPNKDRELAESILRFRAEYRAELESRGFDDVVFPFEEGKYNPEASMGENLLFGRASLIEGAFFKIVRSEFFRKTLRDSGLGDKMYRAGHAICGTAVSLLDGLDPDDEMFARMSLFSAEELPEYKQALRRKGPDDFDKLNFEERIVYMRLAYLYTENTYRFGIVTKEIESLIVQVRERMRRDMPEEMRPLIEPYDPDRFIYAADVRDNILFGKVNSRLNNVQEILRDVGKTVSERIPEDGNRIFHLGLGFDVGAGGRRLTATQRRKINIARALLRRSDYYVFNRPLLGIDRQQQSEIVAGSVAFLMDRPDPPVLIWVLSDEAHIKNFARIVKFDAGAIVADSATCAYVADQAHL